MTINRVKTGIPGLDDLVGEGLPEKSTILISGSAGTGKTILGLQFLCYGAENNEPGIYLTIEESKDKILTQAEQFGWNLEKLEAEKKLVINVMKESDISAILEKLEKEAKEINAKRLVIDSLSMLSIFSRFYSDIDRKLFTDTKPLSVHGRELTRTEVYLIIRKINSMGLTTLLISELPEKGEFLSRDTVSEFACDGVIVLKKDETTGKRKLIVEKMRNTEIELIPKDLSFTSEGIKVG